VTKHADPRQARSHHEDENDPQSAKRHPRNRADSQRPLADMARAEQAKRGSVSTWFSSVATAASNAMGSATAFFFAIGIIVMWALSGPMFDYSDTWQLIINTGTTILTFLMVFLIQNTQNRDAKAINLKLNELIHAVNKAHNEMIDIEKLSDEELKRLDEYYMKIREEGARRRAAGEPEEEEAA
jgi:low affinity Fe/Cu permease